MKRHTSALANLEMETTGAKQNLKEKIFASMKINGSGTYEQIAKAAGLRNDQVWKRLSEMENEGLIYSTTMTDRLSSGKQGMIWALCIPVDKVEAVTEKIISHYTEQGKLFINLYDKGTGTT